MVNVKKNTTFVIYFVFLLTFSFFISCKPKKDVVYEIQGNLIPINEKLTSVDAIDQFITPYRNHINNDLDSILCYNPATQDKSKGKWETNIGNLFAQSTFELSNPIFQKRTQKKIDLCLLNHGGIRSIIPEGNVTTRTAFEIMPFENSVIVVGLSGDEIIELARYILKEKKPHPLYGIKIFTNPEENKVEKIEINDVILNKNSIYYVATSDYLANGGDNMTFFKKSTIKYDLDYKLRSLFIDYFKKVDTLPNLKTKIIITE